MDSKLTDKQIAFCIEYIKDWNATRAAIAAGYSEKTARNIASENLAKPYIADYIEEIQKDIQKLANISYLSQIKYFQTYIEDAETSNAEKLRAARELNKMLGFYAPKRSEHTIKGALSLSTKEDIADELRKLGIEDS